METAKLYDIYGGRGVDGSPILVKEEKERKSGDFKNGEKCNRNVLNNPLKTPRQGGTLFWTGRPNLTKYVHFFFKLVLSKIIS